MTSDVTLAALGAVCLIGAIASRRGSAAVEDNARDFERAIERFARAARGHYAAGRHGSFMGNTFLLHNVVSRTRQRWQEDPDAWNYLGPSAPRGLARSWDRANRATLLELLGMNRAIMDGARKIAIAGRGLIAEDPEVRKVYEELRKGTPIREIPEGFELCTRCGGRGRISAYRHISGGICYDCSGAGLVQAPGTY